MRVLILGVTGQDGSYLAEQLLEAGDEVWGLVHQKTSVPDGVHLVRGDLTEEYSLEDAFHAVQPDEIYNLAAVTAPGGAWGVNQLPGLANVTGTGVVRVLEMMRRCVPEAHLVHASSSAVYDPHRYGLYGISKQFAHEAVRGYRQGYGLHVSNAVLFSHTSARQDDRFLAPTITRTLTRIKNGSDEHLKIANFSDRRDWGYAPDFMRALPLIARTQTARDYDVATGVTHSTWDFVKHALKVAGLDDCVVETYMLPQAPVETTPYMGFVETLGWAPQTSFERMIEIMMGES